MDYRRAKEIIESYGVIAVRYQDLPVWIEQVHPDQETAEVTDIYNERLLDVPLTGLVEDE